jgi:hypothetical protein
MNRDDIIRMAQEAGFTTAQDVWPQEFERFAARVRADEREACAKLIEAYPVWIGDNAKREIAAALRAREKK